MLRSINNASYVLQGMDYKVGSPHPYTCGLGWAVQLDGRIKHLSPDPQINLGT